VSKQPVMTLSDGRTIPQLGLGVWQVSDNEAAVSVATALACGYRHIDTAAIYENEVGVGDGLKRGGVPRSDVFVTTKVWNDAQGFDATMNACEKSLARLALDYVDLYLIHWPAPRRDLYVDTWRALIQLREDGKTRSIGVSNFGEKHLDRIIGETGVAPVLNQIELHPRFQQRTLRAVHQRLGIATDAWSPLGQGKLLADPEIAEIAAKHGKSAAQIIIRWHVQKGNVVIPKSVTPSRIKENFEVFDFLLDTQDMAVIDGLDSHVGRIGPDPSTASF
jgi:2,5-diketo-D-gluconate reductase A